MRRTSCILILTTILLLSGLATADFGILLEDAASDRLTVKGSYDPGNETPVELFCAVNKSLSPDRLSARTGWITIGEEEQSWQCTDKVWENYGVVSCAMTPPEQLEGEGGDLSDQEICRQCHRAPERGMTVERCRDLYCTGSTEETGQPAVRYDRANTVSCWLRRWQETNGEYRAFNRFAQTPLFNATVETRGVAPNTQYQGRSINTTCTIHNTGNLPLFGVGNPVTARYQATVSIGGEQQRITGGNISVDETWNVTGAVTIPRSVNPGTASIGCTAVTAAGHRVDTATTKEQIQVKQPPFILQTVQARREGTVNQSTVTAFDTVVFEGEITEYSGNVSYTAAVTRGGATVATPPIQVENNRFQVRYTPGDDALPGTYHAAVTGSTQDYTETETAAFTVEPVEGRALLNLSWVAFPPDQLEDRFRFEFELLRGGDTVPASFVENTSCGVVNDTSGELLNPVPVNRTPRDTYAATYESPAGVSEGFFACDVALAAGQVVRLQDWYFNAFPWPLLIGLGVFVVAVIGVFTAGVVKWRQSGSSKTESIKGLKRKLRSIQDAKQEAQRKYFNRNLDEDTFTAMMQEYKENEMQLEAELAALQEEQEKEADRENSG